MILKSESQEIGIQMIEWQSDAQYHVGAEMEIGCDMTTREAVMMITQLPCMEICASKTAPESRSKCLYSGNSAVDRISSGCHKLHAHDVGSRFSLEVRCEQLWHFVSDAVRLLPNNLATWRQSQKYQQHY